MKTILAMICMIFLCNFIGLSQDNKNEQQNKRAQCVFGEIGGNGLFISANYDVRFRKKQNGFGARAGLGYIADPFGDADGITIPLGLNYLAGHRGHYLEAGIGATVFTLKGSSIFDINVNERGLFYVPSLGYRYQPLSKGFTGRIFISPIIAEGSGALWGGISAGYKF